jgi:hypothetical protein
VRAELARRGKSQREFALENEIDQMWLNRRIGRRATVPITVDEVEMLPEKLRG